MAEELLSAPTGVTVGQQVPPPLETTSAAAAVPAAPLANPSERAESDAPYLDLVPPVAGERTGPGTPLTLLAGTALAAVAWWVRRRWLSPRPTVSTENPEDLD